MSYTSLPAREWLSAAVARKMCTLRISSLWGIIGMFSGIRLVKCIACKSDIYFSALLPTCFSFPLYLPFSLFPSLSYLHSCFRFASGSFQANITLMSIILHTKCFCAIVNISIRFII